MENSNIEWTDHTFSPWRGCTKVSAGCANCYAETMSHRNPLTLGVWGDQGTRVIAAESYWKQPLKWNKAAKVAGVRHRVFCASLADVFEDWGGKIANARGGIAQVEILGEPEPLKTLIGGKWVETQSTARKVSWRDATMQDVRDYQFATIDATPNLDWLLLTKRPENIARMMPEMVCGGHEIIRPNLWLGTSVENQEQADKRIPHLLKVPAAVRFLSCEPLLGPLDLRRFMWPVCKSMPARFNSWAEAEAAGELTYTRQSLVSASAVFLDWVIVGGESGPNARPCRVEWVRSIVQQCRAAGVLCFVKQMGGNVITRNDMIEDAFNSGKSGWPDPEVEHDIHGFREEYQGADCRIRLRDRKGGDINEWPEDLRVREFPN